MRLFFDGLHLALAATLPQPLRAVGSRQMVSQLPFFLLTLDVHEVGVETVEFFLGLLGVALLGDAVIGTDVGQLQHEVLDLSGGSSSFYGCCFLEGRGLDRPAFLVLGLALLLVLLPGVPVLVLIKQLRHGFLLLTNEAVDVVDLLALLLSLAQLVEPVFGPQHQQNQDRLGRLYIFLMGKKIKTCLVGDSAVGKTSILLRIIDGCFKEGTASTIGADYKSQVRKIEGDDVEVELWDTSGQDRYRSIAKNFFRGSDGIFVVFSLAEDQSLKGLEYWVEQVKDVLDPTVPKILLGNKADLQKEPSAEAQKVIRRLREEEGFTFFAVSAKTGVNLKEAYEALISQAYKYMKANGTSKSVFIPPKNDRKKGGCC